MANPAASRILFNSQSLVSETNFVKIELSRIWVLFDDFGSIEVRMRRVAGERDDELAIFAKHHDTRVLVVRGLALDALALVGKRVVAPVILWKQPEKSREVSGSAILFELFDIRDARCR